MSIEQDRSDLFEALKKLPAIDDIEMNISKYAPQKAEPYTVYIELAGVDQATTFGHLHVTWEVTATASARLANTQAAAVLDTLTGSIITAIHGAKSADLAGVEPYFVLTDNSNGASIPATRITFVSQTPIN